MADAAPRALPLHETLRAHARTMPSRAAQIWYGRVITWAELDAASDAFAARDGMVRA
jgi:long-chain acyl-CoA synthetase